MASSAKPKSAKPGNRAAPAAEPDPSALLPADLPAECPFQVTWRPAVFAVQAADGFNLSAVKDALKQLHVLSHVTLSDLAARLDPADPLCADSAAAAAEGQQHAAVVEGASVPIGMAAKLLQRQFNKDQALAWKFEIVRRREQLARLAAEAKVAQDALANAESAQSAASSRLEAVKARLPQPAPPPAVLHRSGAVAIYDAAGAAEEEDGQPGAAAAATVPPLKLQQVPAEDQEVTLSPELRRALTGAKDGLEAADKELQAAKAAAAAAATALMAAKDNLNGPFQHYEPYWVDGLPTTAAGLSATVSAGIPLRAVVWVHPSAVAPSADNSSARLSASGNARPASGATTRQSSAAGGVPAAVVYTLPAELQQLQNTVRAAAWGFELSELLVLQLSVEDAASPFTRVPAGSSITDPAWAAASSAAAAAKAAAAAAAAAAAPPPDVKPASSAGKAGSNVSFGAKTSSSGSARPGSSVAGASAAAAAAALPEEVHGCKELARVLLTVRDQAKRFDKWQKQDVHVYRMPAPSTRTAAAGSSDSQRMRYYSHLLDSAPPERQSVPLVLHAVLEQVRQNCLIDSTPEAAVEADQTVLAAQVDDAISAAFSSLVDEQSSLVQEPCQTLPGLTVLQHGDDLAAAACGLTTGYPQGQPAGASNSAQQQGSDWPFAARGLSSQDVDAVEQHMLQLVQLPGVSAADTGSIAADGGRGPAIERQLHQAELKSLCHRVHCGTVRRSQLLEAAASMLPPEVQAAHAADIKSRNHQEPLQPHVLKQVLQHSRLELPHICSMHHQPAGADLVALYAGPQLEQVQACSMPHAMTFYQYWQKLLQGTCQAPDLNPQVYEMSEAAASQHWQRKLLYTQAGGIARTGTDGLLAISQGPSTVRMLPPEEAGKPHQLVATLDRGAVVAASVLAVAPPSPARPAPCPAAPPVQCDVHATDASGIAPPATARPSETASVASSAQGKKPPGSAAKIGPSTGQALAALGVVLEDSAMPDRVEQPGAAASDPAACGREMPQWASLSVTTPQGLFVQLSTEGCVTIGPVKPNSTQCVEAAVDVLGALLATGTLQAQVPASTSAWHAVLPNGTLIKAAAPDRAATPAGSSYTTTILHPDGSCSQQQQQELTLAGVGVSMKQRVAGWLRTSPDGEQVWAVDTVALQNLRTDLAKTAEEAAAAGAAAAAEAAAAAAAAESTGKKGSKGTKKSQLDKQASSKIPNAKQRANEQPQQQPEQAVSAAAAAAAAVTGSAEPGSTPGLADAGHVAAAAAAEAVLLDLERQPPQSMGSIRAVRLTDADTGAVVTTREDHLLIVDYPDGSKLLQDAEGCRLSHAAGTWLFEAAGIPAVKGDESGVTLEPCPGVCLSWDAGRDCVTLVHTAADAVISLAPSGHVVYSPNGQPVDPLLDCCMDLADQQQQQGRQPALEGAENAQSEQQQQQEAPDGVPCQGADVQECRQGLADVCNQPDCWGLLGLDLMTGEAALHEENLCRLHIGPGGAIQVWNTKTDKAEVLSAESAAAASAAAGTADGGVASEEQAASPAAVAAAAAAAAVEAVEAAAAAVNDESLTDEEVAAKKAAAVAAEKAAAEAAEAAVVAAEAAAAAARAVPKPVAPGTKPRLFVVDPASGSGYEVLPWEVVDQYAAVLSRQPGTQHMQQEPLGADEPGTVCHTFLSSYTHKVPVLQPLEVAQPTQVLPVEVDPNQSLVSLRRVETVVQSVWQAGQGFKLPRIAALSPLHLAHAAPLPEDTPHGAHWAGSGGAGSGCEGSAATRLSGSGAAGGSVGQGQVSTGGQVVVVREVLELPELGPEVQEQVAAVMTAWEAHKIEQQQSLALRAPSPTNYSQQQLEDAKVISTMLEAAGFEPVPPVAAAAAAAPSDHQEAAQAARQFAGSRAYAGSGRQGTGVSPAGPGRLKQVKDKIIEQQQAAAAATSQARLEAAARAAAEAEAKKKPYKPWVKKAGPYDHAPQKPQPGETLKYFGTQEGLQALSTDASLQSGTRLTKAHLPPPKPVQPASAGKQQVPGVYLASSTSLCDAGAEPAEAGSYAAGLGALGGCNSPGGTCGSKAGTCGSNVACSPAQPAPLMHAGRPTRLGSPVTQRQQPVEAVAAATAAQFASCSGEQLTASSTGKGPVRDVYGQPRVVLPALPATYSKAHAAGSLNTEYLSREGATIRATKTSSASLVRASGRNSKQIVLRPAHLHFGSIPVGAVVHRTAKLLNGSSDVVRFTIMRPELPLRVMHKPEPLPPGMEATFTVELVAEQAGDLVGEVTVKTELNVFTLSVSAKVLPAPEQTQTDKSGVIGTAEGRAAEAGDQHEG